MNYYIVGFRAIAIICIILHHSISIYQGWPPNSGLGIYAQVISFFLKWIGLGGFVFISGYCMYYSQIIKKKTFRQWLNWKIRRILLPLLVFSITYYMIYPQFVFDVWPAPLNGTHLWFLMMIFLCMLVLSVHLYYPRHSSIIISIIYFSIVLTNMYIMPFRTFDEFTVFFPIFVLGYWGHHKGLFPNTECGVHFFKSKIVKLLNNHSFKLYLLHQFFINLLLIVCIEQIRMTKYFFVIPCVFIFSLLMSLIIGEMYDKILNRVLTNANK